MNNISLINKVISGGQSGVDRAALDAAINCRLNYGGYCPRDGWAEDMPDPPGLLAPYPNLTATISENPAERTELNVLYSDATLILCFDKINCSTGTQLTQQLAEKYRKPFLIADLEKDHPDKLIVTWVKAQAQPLKLNIAGPRESESPGIYQLSYQLLSKLILSLNSGINGP